MTSEAATGSRGWWRDAQLAGRSKRAAQGRRGRGRIMVVPGWWTTALTAYFIRESGCAVVILNTVNERPAMWTPRTGIRARTGIRHERSDVRRGGGNGLQPTTGHGSADLVGQGGSIRANALGRRHRGGPELIHRLAAAVIGPWGSGKTSVLHLVRSRLDESRIVRIEFNPWLFAGTDQLVQAFFGQLVAELSSSKDERIRTAADRIEKYSELLDPLGDVPGVGGFAKGRAQGSRPSREYSATARNSTHPVSGPSGPKSSWPLKPRKSTSSCSLMTSTVLKKTRCGMWCGSFG